VTKEQTQQLEAIQKRGISQLTAGYCHFGWLVGKSCLSVCAINRSASDFPNALVFCCVRAGPSCKLGSARTRPRVIFPSLQLGTVTLAGWRLSVACQCECLSVGPSVRPAYARSSRAINRSAQRTGPAVSWAPRVGAHEYCPRDAMLARSLRQRRVCPSVRLSVCHTPVFCLAERKQDREMYTL